VYSPISDWNVEFAVRACFAQTGLYAKQFERGTSLSSDYRAHKTSENGKHCAMGAKLQSHCLTTPLQAASGLTGPYTPQASKERVSLHSVVVS
jgi:hypothetical protein